MQGLFFAFQVLALARCKSDNQGRSLTQNTTAMQAISKSQQLCNKTCRLTFMQEYIAELHACLQGVTCIIKQARTLILLSPHAPPISICVFASM